MTKKIQIPVKFYIVLALTLVLVAFIVAITARGVLGGIKTASEVDDSLLRAASPRLNEQGLKKALDTLESKSAPALDSHF